MEDFEKKYKEALERARIWKGKSGMPIDKQGILDDIFPELGESEGEESKKWILEYLHDGLRKSDEQFKDQFKSAIAWLEKQGEQKPFDYEHATIIQKDFAPKDYHDIDPHFGISVEDLMSKEKPADNVEPKFKVGDWICNNSHSYLIAYIDLEQRRYLFEIGGYTHEQLNWEYIENADSKYHLWTIQDAKDGDVLAFEPIEGYPSPFIVLYKEQCKTRPECFYSYCFISHLGDFCNGGDICDSKNIHPATKEQRELLFRKMKEAGYVWNPTTKELSHKEVTKKSDKVWNEEDEEMKDLIDEISCHNDDVDYETHVRITRWLNELKQRLS